MHKCQIQKMNLAFNRMEKGLFSMGVYVVELDGVLLRVQS